MQRFVPGFVAIAALTVLWIAAWSQPDAYVLDDAWAVSEEPELPYGSVIDEMRDLLYVSDCPGNAVLQYDLSSGKLIRLIGDEQLNHPTGLALGRDGRLYVADWKNHRVVRFSPDGRLIDIFGEHGAMPGQFNLPYDVAVDSEGNIYVVEYGNHRVQKFTAAWRPILQWGGQGEAPGKFFWPLHAAFDAQENLYITDTNHRVQVFTRDGQLLRSWGRFGIRPGQFRYPTEITVFEEYIYVADSHNHRVQVFSLQGDPLGAYPAGRNPKTVTLDPSGRLYVGMIGEPHVVRFRVTR